MAGVSIGLSPVVLANRERNGASNLNDEEKEEEPFPKHNSTALGRREDSSSELKKQEVESAPDSEGRNTSKSKKRNKGHILRWGSHEEAPAKVSKIKKKSNTSEELLDIQQVVQMESSGGWNTTGSENEAQLEDLKSGDPKKLHKLNKELGKQNRQLSKSVESLRKERDSLLSDKQKLKIENKSLEKELKRATKGHQHLLRQESIEIAEDGVELPKKVEWLEAQLAEKEGEIANLKRKLELKAELFESSKGSGLVVNAECCNCNPESEIPHSKLAMQKNGDALNMNLALERLLEQQDITSRYRQENSELKLRISSLEAELEQVFAPSTSPKTHRKASALFKRGKRHSSGKLSDEAPTGKVAGAETRVSKSPDFIHICNSSQEHLADSVSPQPSPRHFLPRNRSGSAVTDVHTLQACLKLALEEKQSLISQKQVLEEKLEAAKKPRKPSQPHQEVELLKQTLKVALGEKESLSEQLKSLEREVATAKERTEDLEKRLAESLVQKDSFAEQQRDIKALREENERLKKSLADSTAKNATVQQLEQQNEKLRKEIAELRASADSKPAAKSPVVEQQNEKLKKETAVQRTSAGSKPAARDLEQQNEKLKKDVVELRVSALSSKPAARDLEQQNEKLKKETAVRRTSTGSKPAARDLEQQNEKLKKDVVELRVSALSSKPAARDLEQQNEKLKRDTVVSSARSKSETLQKLRKLSTGKLKESGPTSPKMNTVAATRALFEEKIEDSRQQAKSLSPKHNRNSVILGREKRGTTWNGSESGPPQAEEKPVTIPPQTRAVSTISLAPISRSNVSPPKVSPPLLTHPISTSSSSSVKSGAKPGAQTASKMSISVKSSLSPCASPTMNTCKDIKEVEVQSPKIELSSPGSVPHRNQTQHPPIRKTMSLTTTAQPVVSSLVAKKKEIQVTSHVVSPGSSAGQQDLGKPKSPSYTTHTVTPSPSPATVPTRTEKATFKQTPGKLSVQSSIEVKRASSLQNIPENVSTSSSLTVNSGGGTSTTSTSPTTRNPVLLRQNRRAPKQRPKTLHADTVNLTSFISKLQEQEKKETSRPPRPTSVYGGETNRVAPFGMKAPSLPAMSTKPDPSERKLKRAATVTYGFERHSKKALLLRWCQKITEDYDNISIDNFGESFSDGMAFCAILHHFIPDKIPLNTLTSQSREKNFKIAFEAAEKAGIPALLDVEDMVALPIPDWMSVMTYVSFIYNKFVQSQ